MILAFLAFKKKTPQTNKNFIKSFFDNFTSNVQKTKENNFPYSAELLR